MGITIGPFKKGPQISLLQRDHKVTSILETWHKRKYHGNLAGRTLSANTFLQSQYVHLYPNASLVESDLKVTQQTIDKFVNKKYITSGDTIHVFQISGDEDRLDQQTSKRRENPATNPTV